MLKLFERNLLAKKAIRKNIWITSIDKFHIWKPKIYQEIFRCDFSGCDYYEWKKYFKIEIVIIWLAFQEHILIWKNGKLDKKLGSYELRMQQKSELKKRPCSDYFLRFPVADVEKSL